ncbi:type II secretion system F family protein [Vibrio comitans]|uniref:TadB involved in pilus formation and/or protein secretion n=1 Tax=Vibrio comitans NBRC 102076 TaxID=1219078 RepID=A0A4Y3INK6_9VIBR|nr:type II secretion system F family protein [Vibrio comitans]GEA60672.1 TadB involved in pilus formation and/or protein secretion [Vibrio comitans NBRC 102076]
MGLAYIILALGLSLALYSFTKRKPDPRAVFLQSVDTKKTKDKTAVDINGLVQSSVVTNIKNFSSVIKASLGNKPVLKVIFFLITVNFISVAINTKWFELSNIYFCLFVSTLSTFIALKTLIDKRRKAFNNDFPDALNILMSAVTAGESINGGFTYVGKVSDTDIGREFKDISDRMKLGESIESIFSRSSRRFPYPPFLFFVITIRANIERGGQLKSVLGKLIRVLVESRNLEKKKMAMTSEARISAKIVGAIPFIFLFFLNLVNPKDLEFVLYNPDGRWILYYLLISEFIGLGIVWWLVRSIR